MKHALVAVIGVVASGCERAPATVRAAPAESPSRGDRETVAVAPRLASGDGSVLSSERCESPRHGAVIVRTLAACDARELERARAFAPDALVVLGGGLLVDDEPSCATVQRARAALELATSIDSNVSIVLSGRGPSRAPILLDAAEGACLRARLEGELDARSAPEPDRRAARARLASVLETNRATLTEADGMCAAMLRRVDASRWRGFLARMLFDPASTDTVQNADFSTPILERSSFERVLIVTSPVRHNDGSVDNHAERALGDFRRARSRTRGRFVLGAIGCPYVDGGPSWAAFESARAATP